MIRYYIGIDPGSSGGIAAVWNGDGVRWARMPATEERILGTLRNIGSEGESVAVVERIGRSTWGAGKAVTSLTSLYGSYTALRMALTAARIPFVSVPPQRWQKGLGISPRKKGEDRTAWKNRLKREAEELFPKIKVTLATADALLLAEYCRRTYPEGIP